MHEDRAACRALRAIVGVRVAHIEREIILRCRIHLAGRDLVEAFRHLAIAFAHFWTQLARPAAHRVGPQRHVAPIRFHFPNFEFRFLLIGADEDWRRRGEPFFLDERKHVWRKRMRGPDGAGHPETTARAALVASGHADRATGDQSEPRDTMQNDAGRLTNAGQRDASKTHAKPTLLADVVLDRPSYAHN